MDREIKMCKPEETLEKLDNAEAMIGRATNMLRELQGLGLAPKKCEEQALFRRRVVQVTSELEDVRDLLTASARAVLSERQLEVLEPQGEEEEEEEEEEVVVDPSIQFLGLEWEAIFGKCFNLGINIRIYRQRLGAGSVDTLTLALVLRDLQRVVAEVEHHSRAVLAKDREGLHQAMMGGSTNQINVQDRRQGVTYRKTKTEGLASKIANVAKRKSTNEGAKKKNSFVGSLSNLFKNPKA